ncbi:tRNA lysidine(34) synthetase TilS [Rossellomorea aquimaris]|uniref:tRNA lysidine(34) synthetase TilS n=1 Tax=Rossellomorea aquimaris TaxID=189382 RepID=UPI0007D07B2B|nr:tRNA lysidine(34) synthetase TilS [Rossellomorea aquimaris]
MLESSTKEFIQSHELIQKGDVLVVAVSGGPDSLALLHFLHANRRVWEIELVAAHLDHMFRGEESLNELLFVKGFCERLDIPFFGERIDVSQVMKESNGGLQKIARDVRYTFLNKIMIEVSANKLVLGHHGDDQIETILMKLTRGANGVSRAGIPLIREFSPGKIIRPFLSVTKEDIEKYCEEYNLSPRRDPSNEKEDYTRNRFRKAVVPFLKEENPLVHKQFQQFSEELIEDEGYLEELTRQKLNKVWNKSKDFSTLDIKGFLTMAQPLQRRGINLILNYLYKLRPPSLSSIHIYDVLGILRGKTPNASLDLPSGLKVTRAYHTCYFHFGELECIQSPYCYELNVHETLELSNGYQFDFYPAPVNKEDCNGQYVYLHEDHIALPLSIRTRKPGDRIKLKGFEGSKKLKSLFIDEKIPVHLRDQWPIVVDAEERILWVPGIKKSIYDLGEAKEKSLVLQLISNHLLGGS